MSLTGGFAVFISTEIILGTLVGVLPNGVARGIAMMLFLAVILGLVALITNLFADEALKQIRSKK